MARYQSIIDVLVDAGCYESIHYDHETELPSPYRGTAFLNRNALQEHAGKGSHLHKKWADICAIQNGKARVIIEEERHPTEKKVSEDIATIVKCRYVWTDEDLFPFDPHCVLFILLNDNVNRIRERTSWNVGSIKTVIVCDKESFREKYAEYSVPRV